MNRPFDSSQIDTSRTAIHAELDSILASTKPGGDATPASQLHPSFEQGISAFPDAPSTPASPFTAMVDRTSVITQNSRPRLSVLVMMSLLNSFKDFLTASLMLLAWVLLRQI